YLTGQMRTLYASYVDHEGRLREQLNRFRQTGQELRNWRRAFFLNPGLRPTRNQMIDLEPIRNLFSDDWFYPRWPHDPAEAAETNRQVVRTFLQRLGNVFAPDTGHEQRTPIQSHLVARNVSLNRVNREFLTQLRLSAPRDSALLNGLLLQV